MLSKFKKVKCLNCGKESFLISSTLGVCDECIREDFEKVTPFIEKAHQKTRKEFKLPSKLPRSKEDIVCNLCLNNCKISPGEVSFCGLRKNREGKLKETSSLKDYQSFKIS